MCLYPSLQRNPKYKANKKNGGVIPPVSDTRVLAVPIGCGRCKECLKQKSNDWKIRLYEEIKANKNGQFVTLTFSNESYKELLEEQREKTKLNGYDLDNAVAILAVKRFLERWRKKHKKQPRHWLVTELGHQGTENIHLHGIIFDENEPDEIEKHWQYGFVWNGYGQSRTYVNNKTINYISKYITKTDKQHKYYVPRVLCSKGIGSPYLKTFNATNHKNGQEYYVTPSGHKMALPMYYRNKIYSDKEKEQLWLAKIDQNVRYVDGIKIDISKDQKDYINTRNAARLKYLQLGYNGKYNWKENVYENEQRVLLQNERIKSASGGPSPGRQVKVDNPTIDENDMSKYTDIDKWL